MLSQRIISNVSIDLINSMFTHSLTETVSNCKQNNIAWPQAFNHSHFCRQKHCCNTKAHQRINVRRKKKTMMLETLKHGNCGAEQ
jgi:arylamine N-acetyltransferase